MIAVQVPLFADLGLWIGLVLSLLLFSALVRENGLARLAQHILVGAGLGYAVVLVVRDLLWRQTLMPQQRDPGGEPALWFALGLLLVMLVGGAVAMAAPRGDGRVRWPAVVGAVPVALMVGFGIAVAAIGMIQGTLAPQFLRAAATGISTGGAPVTFFSGVLTLLITSGVLVHLLNRDARDLQTMPGWMRTVIAGWAGIGKRAVWLAAGVIFARLIVSRLSLLIAQLQLLATMLQTTGFWHWLGRG